MNINDITITSLETINAFDIVTGAFRFTLDELQNATIAQTQEKTDITGKQGRKLNSLKKNKAAVVSGTNGLLSGGLMEAQTGSKFGAADGNVTVRWSETLTVASNKATTTYKAIGTAGAEIVSLHIKKADGTLDTKLEQTAAAADNKFAYTPGSKELTFHTNVEDGTMVYVVYDRTLKGQKLSNESGVYSDKLQLYIDAFGEDLCSNVYRIQFYIPRADFSGNFDFTMGNGQAVHAFEAESLAGACGASGVLWDYTIFGSEEGDVAGE